MESKYINYGARIYEHAWGLNIGIFDWLFKGRNPSEVLI
jgi:hypothetical protein